MQSWRHMASRGRPRPRPAVEIEESGKSYSANEQHDPLIVMRSEEDYIDLIIRFPGRTWAESVTLDPKAWDTILAIALRDCPQLLSELRDLEDGVPLGFADDDHVRSVVYLAMLVENLTSTSHISCLAECWVALPPSQRAEFWRSGRRNKLIHAQLIGARSSGGERLELNVPDWLPKLVEATKHKSVTTLGHLIHWAWTDSPLGTSCIAWRNANPNDTDGHLAISNCPVAVAPAYDPDRRKARNAIELLTAARDAIVANDSLQRVLEWCPTGHEVMEIEAALQDWRDRLS